MKKRNTRKERAIKLREIIFSIGGKHSSEQKFAAIHKIGKIKQSKRQKKSGKEFVEEVMKNGVGLLTIPK